MSDLQSVLTEMTWRRSGILLLAVLTANDDHGYIFSDPGLFDTQYCLSRTYDLFECIPLRQAAKFNQSKTICSTRF